MEGLLIVITLLVGIVIVKAIDKSNQLKYQENELRRRELQSNPDYRKQQRIEGLEWEIEQKTKDINETEELITHALLNSMDSEERHRQIKNLAVHHDNLNLLKSQLKKALGKN